jgi:hypothetical protein
VHPTVDEQLRGVRRLLEVVGADESLSAASVDALASSVVTAPRRGTLGGVNDAIGKALRPPPPPPPARGNPPMGGGSATMPSR